MVVVISTMELGNKLVANYLYSHTDASGGSTWGPDLKRAKRFPTATVAAAAVKLHGGAVLDENVVRELAATWLPPAESRAPA